ncbi:MAG: hypothetical protein OEZ59_04955 [Deltaproteobacteria bacterium]|nr:hypothetical protein [Deltaproteobacteria bacterium]
MSKQDIDKLSAIKASLEMMVAENEEIHNHFKDLLDKFSEMENLGDDQRREQFQEMKKSGDLNFQGVDIRHFVKTPQGPLSPPIFFSRTRRRLKNTVTLIQAFQSKGLLPEGEELREDMEALIFAVVNEHDYNAVKIFREQVEELRASPRFSGYTEAKKQFLAKDAGLRADAEFVAARESVENGEEMLRERDSSLAALSEQLDSPDFNLDDAQSQLDALSLDNELEPKQGQGEAVSAMDLDGSLESSLGLGDDGDVGLVPGLDLDSSFDVSQGAASSSEEEDMLAQLDDSLLSDSAHSASAATDEEDMSDLGDSLDSVLTDPGKDGS